MYFSHLSEIAQTKIPTQPASWLARRVSISYHNIVKLAGLVDVVLIVTASLLGGTLYNYFFDQEFHQVDVALGVALTNGLFYVYAAKIRGLYSIPELLAANRNIYRVIVTWLIAGFSVSAFFMLLKVGTNLPRAEIFTVAVLQISFLLPARWIIEQILCAMIMAGGLTGRKVVVIGETSELIRLSSSDLFHYFGLKEIGRVPVAESSSEGFGLDAELESLDRGLKEAREKNAEEIVIALRWGSKALLERVRDRMRATPLPVRLLPDSTIRSVLGRRSISADGPVLSVEIQRAPLTSMERATKRALDIALSSFAILMLSPILIGAAIAIKLDSAGPIIFRQRRNGFNSRQFVIFKFRTMTVCEDGAVIQQARRGDRRVTRVGQFLRRSSIDELPQLFNVLIGDMSLVGPRPHALAHDDEYKSLIAKYAFRHHVKPGMTGWAQVNGLRGETGQLGQMIDRIKLDLWYINHWSFGFDLSILIRTCVEVFRNRAY